MATATRPRKTTEPFIAAPALTGYSADIKYYATRYKQGGRTVYALDLSPLQVIATVGRPDPAKPAPGNRAIRPQHAIGFARYFRARKNWVIPAMILRSAIPFEFEPLTEIEGAEFGVLSIPRSSIAEIHIADGQHRILGFHLASEGIAADLDKARSQLAAARRQDPNGATVREAERRIAEIQEQAKRLESERVSLQIVVVEDPREYKQMFFDIADNALGITGGVKARFDATKVVNRALESVLEHPLFLGRVDLERDRVTGNSPYFVGAKHAADITRSVIVGLTGRVSANQDKTWKEQDVAARTKVFLDTLMNAFPPLTAMVNGQLLPSQLRKTSLLGSVLMLRILAGAYHDLKAEHAFTDEMVFEYFTKLAPHMAGPVHPGSIWMAHLNNGIFDDGALAPRSRNQDLKYLKNQIVDWAILRPEFLDEEPAPRPEPEPEETDPEFGVGYTEHGADIPLID